MKTLLIASTLAVGALAFSTAGWAKTNDGHPPVQSFGPVYEMQSGEHTMHMQLIEDKDGGQWVVMSREEAEMLLGMKLDGHPYGKLS